MIAIWIPLALLAALGFAGSNIVDKIIIDRHVKKPLVVIIILGLLDVILGIFIIILSHSVAIHAGQILLLLLAGMLDQLGAILYFFSLSREEVSRTVPIFYFNPLLVALVGYFFFKESFSPLVYIGIATLSFGAILLNIRKGESLKFKLPFFLMLGSACAYAGAILMTKYLVENVSYWGALGWIFVGMGVASIPLFAWKHHQLLNMKKRDVTILFKWALMLEGISLFAYFCMVNALAHGPVSLINALMSLQAPLVLFFAILISVNSPRHIKEAIDKKSLSFKVGGIVLMFIGVLFIIF